MIKGIIRRGDVIWMDCFNELIEVVWCNPIAKTIAYWGSRHPDEAGTTSCRVADAGVIFRFGVKVGRV